MYNKQFINYDQSQEILIIAITKCISINCFTLKTPRKNKTAVIFVFMKINKIKNK